MSTKRPPGRIQPVEPTGPLSGHILEVAHTWARSQHQLVVLSAEFADSHEWAVAGSPTAAHWLAAVADIETCTAREWIRIGKRLNHLPATADAFEAGRISYSKVRTLTRVATPENEAELLDIALEVPAGDVGRALAAWMNRNSSAEDLAAHHQRQRSVMWRNEPDGMVTFTLRLPPALAGMLIAFLTTWVMTRRPAESCRGTAASADAFGSLAQQRADAVEALLAEGAGGVEAEVVLHVRGDGCALDDGTPVPETVVEHIASQSFIRALIHDADGKPINASGRQRHPTTRQKRVVKERDRVCVDCRSAGLHEYDHSPPFEISQHTVIDELELRCAPCHRRRHE